ncbi:MAG UNVERIFIED_CONTAM: ubiquinol-cytochrome c reductase iron-sulfur subunit [Planctomycetaceae bacterium]
MTDSPGSSGSIIDKIRAAKAAAASGAPSPAPAASPPASPSPAAAAAIADAAASAPAAKPAAPAGTPKSPADIMAAIRAGKGAAATPAATAPAASAAPTAAAAPAGAPKSPADIMAAIRANKAAGAAPAATAPAAKPAAAVAAAAPAKPVGLSPAEMIKAARSAESGVPAAPKVVLPSKPLPGKTTAPATKAAAAPAVERRSAIGSIVATLCSPIVIAWTSFVATATASTLALARFMMPNVLVEPPTRFKIGPPSDYSPGTVSTKWQAQFNIWVVNNEVDGVRCIYALSTVCTHLGCTPNWLEGEQKFKCPCHGSGFYKTGINFEGPAPRPLERVGLRLAEDGMLEVDKSVKFQRELGQWTNTSSFVGMG